MKCPKCKSNLRMVEVGVWGAKRKVVSYQCPDCDYYEFEKESSKKLLEDLRKTPLRIKQKIIKLSHDRLGVYFNKDIIRSLDLRGGEDIDISIPDSKHIIIGLGDRNVKMKSET